MNFFELFLFGIAEAQISRQVACLSRKTIYSCTYPVPALPFIHQNLSSPYAASQSVYVHAQMPFLRHATEINNRGCGVPKAGTNHEAAQVGSNDDGIAGIDTFCRIATCNKKAQSDAEYELLVQSGSAAQCPCMSERAGGCEHFEVSLVVNVLDTCNYLYSK